MNTEKAISAGMKKAGLSSAKYHVFVCLGPDCCSTSEGEQLWELVKKRLKETGIEAMRTKAGCFRICAGGPWLLVYPDGIWYGSVTESRFERILQEHLLAGQPILEWVAAHNHLSPSP